MIITLSIDSLKLNSDNLLALYERIRLISTSTSAAALTSKTIVKNSNSNDNMQPFLVSFIRIIGMLDTRVSLDSFDVKYKLLVAQYQSLLEADMNAASLSITATTTLINGGIEGSSARWLMNDTMINKILVMCLYILHRELITSTNSNGNGLGNMSPISEVAMNVSWIIFEIFGALIRLTSANINVARFLPSIATLCCW
jgi:hypothetical protein